MVDIRSADYLLSLYIVKCKFTVVLESNYEFLKVVIVFLNMKKIVRLHKERLSVHFESLILCHGKTGLCKKECRLFRFIAHGA